MFSEFNFFCNLILSNPGQNAGGQNAGQNYIGGQNVGQNYIGGQNAGRFWGNVDKMPVSEIFLIRSISQ